MPFFPSLKDDAGIAQIYKSNSKTYIPWIQMGEIVMTQDAPLSQGERELLATYVSCLNDCDYCREAHVPSMVLHGIERAVVEALIADIDTAPVDDRLKPIFAFAKKLTKAPATLTQADADKVFAAGWDEAALHCAITVICRFNFMNRLAMGFGLIPPDADQAMANAKRRQAHGYARMHDSLMPGATEKKAG